MIDKPLVEEVLDFIEVQLLLVADEFDLLLVLRSPNIYLLLAEHVVRSALFEHADLRNHQPQALPASIKHVEVGQVLQVIGFAVLPNRQQLLFLLHFSRHLVLHDLPEWNCVYIFSMASLLHKAHLHPSFYISCSILLFSSRLVGELFLLGDLLGDFVGEWRFHGWFRSMHALTILLLKLSQLPQRQPTAASEIFKLRDLDWFVLVGSESFFFLFRNSLICVCRIPIGQLPPHYCLPPLAKSVYFILQHHISVLVLSCVPIQLLMKLG